MKLQLVNGGFQASSVVGLEEKSQSKYKVVFQKSLFTLMITIFVLPNIVIMLKIYVLSDDQESSNALIKLISKFYDVKCIGSSSDFIEIILSIESREKADIVIIDMKLDDDDIVRINKFFYVAYKFIFTCPRDELYDDFFKKNNISYIGKPYQPQEFQKIIDNFKLEYKLPLQESSKTSRYDDHFYIKCDKGKIRRINTADILYIEANQNYIIIHQTEDSQVINFTLNGIEKVLSKDMFIRVHRSFILNFSKIKSVESNRIILSKNIAIPIGQSYKKQIFHLFTPKILDLNKIA